MKQFFKKKQKTSSQISCLVENTKYNTVVHSVYIFIQMGFKNFTKLPWFADQLLV